MEWPPECQHILFNAAQTLSWAADEAQRPFAILKPVISRDGNQWCVLLGKNIQIGVVGFGDSPHEASVAFDTAWYAKISEQQTEAAKEGA